MLHNDGPCDHSFPPWRCGRGCPLSYLWVWIPHKYYLLLTPVGRLPRIGQRVRADTTPSLPTTSPLPARCPPPSRPPPTTPAFIASIFLQTDGTGDSEEGTGGHGLSRASHVVCLRARIFRGITSSSSRVSRGVLLLQMKQARQNVCVRGSVGVGKAKVKVLEAHLAEACLSRPAPAKK